MSSLHYTFTPTRLKPQPRAWERKASTPYASRHDAQKIWKRVPLQGVSANVNATWRKGETKDDGVMRPVKKLRTTTVAGLDSKETRGLCHFEMGEREMRWRGHRVAGSPKPLSRYTARTTGTNSSPSQPEAQLNMIGATETVRD